MAQNCIWKLAEDSDVSGYTLIIPSVAVGNIGQLACDLLISSLNMQKIASVYSPALIPVLGYDPYDLSTDKLSTCCEIYKCSARNIAILQLRAPLVYKYAKTFLEQVTKFFKDKQIKEVIVLTSSFAHEKKHIPTSSFRYVANEQCLHKNTITKLGWMEHEKEDDLWKIYGGGFAILLYNIVTENDIPCLTVFKYCSEGDNIPDAYDMVHHLSDIIQFVKEGDKLLSVLKQPVSWKLMFGGPPPQDIY